MTVPTRPPASFVPRPSPQTREQSYDLRHPEARGGLPPRRSWRAPCAPPRVAPWDPWNAPEGADPERARQQLRDGTWIRLRSLRRDDRAALLEWFDGLSAQSRRLRFFGPKPALAPYEIDRLLDVDGNRQHAILATEGVRGTGRVAGIVRFVRDAKDPRHAEIAIGVVDDFQSRGLGLVLLDRILTAAQCRGIELVIGEALYENRRVGRLVRRVAPDARRRSLGITQQHVIDLARRVELGLLEPAGSGD
ncbi:MAG TPA: GNAT family N-acetyltransferase [Thermoanaerobaculia bacterium]|nr:GNAT family N-acetyltransferase [Thermoanaerobaculia bacterium]